MKSGSVSPSILFLVKTGLAILGPLHFHIIFRISLSISEKKKKRNTHTPGILIGILLNVYTYLGNIAILIVLSLPIHEYGISFHLYRPSLISMIFIVTTIHVLQCLLILFLNILFLLMLFKWNCYFKYFQVIHNQCIEIDFLIWFYLLFQFYWAVTDIQHCISLKCTA